MRVGRKDREVFRREAVMGLLDNILDLIFDDEWVGRHGEKLTAHELNFAKLLGKKGLILRNVYIPKDDGTTSEIDLIYITVKGIFVIESKNYSGWIFGDEKSFKWTASLPNGSKNQFYNPIKQNNTHIRWLTKLINEECPVFSLIVFSERCELKKVPESTSTMKIIKRDRVYAAIRDAWESNPDIFDEKQVEMLYQRIKPYTNVDVSTKEDHIKNIKEKTESIKDGKTEAGGRDSVIFSKDMICPKCGGSLVLRTAKSGKYSGNQFYGCSNYPKCRYILNIAESQT